MRGGRSRDPRGTAFWSRYGVSIGFRLLPRFSELRISRLRGTDLSGAIMSGVADISNRGQTKLTLADLTSADLSGVRGIPNEVQGVTNEEVNLQTPLLQVTTMPNGQKY